MYFFFKKTWCLKLPELLSTVHVCVCVCEWVPPQSFGRGSDMSFFPILFGKKRTCNICIHPVARGPSSKCDLPSALCGKFKCRFSFQLSTFIKTVQAISHIYFLKYNCLHPSLPMSLFIIPHQRVWNSCFLWFSIKETQLVVVLKFFFYFKLPSVALWWSGFKKYTLPDVILINFIIVATKCPSLKITWSPVALLVA